MAKIYSFGGSLEARATLDRWFPAHADFVDTPVDPNQILDCLVIGAGPAGLTAGVYLGRYHRTAVVIDGGNQRASLIPTSHNYPGYPEGIHGQDLLNNLQLQATKWGALIIPGRIETLRKQNGIYYAQMGSQLFRSRTVMLCTGVLNNRPAFFNTMPDGDAIHREGIAQKVIRYCPICDGPEASDKKILIIGSSDHGVSETAFIRNYSANLTICPDSTPALSAADRATLGRMGTQIIDQPVVSAQLNGGDGIFCTFADGTVEKWDIMYPSIGSHVYSELAGQLGLDLAPDGEIQVDAHFTTSDPTVWAAGDVVVGLDQLVTAEHQAATGATAIHNLLRQGQWGIDSPSIPTSKGPMVSDWAPARPAAD